MPCLDAQSEENPHKLPQAVDISVNGIALHHPDSIRHILGTDLHLTDQQSGISSLTVYNRDKTQCLTLFFHPGREYGSVDEFSLKYSSLEPSAHVYHVLQDNAFQTAKHISLGMSKDDVLTILGNPYREDIQSETTTFLYRLTQNEASQFLAQYRMPVYYGKYTFQANRLITCIFGFEYP